MCDDKAHSSREFNPIAVAAGFWIMDELLVQFLVQGCSCKQEIKSEVQVLTHWHGDRQWCHQYARHSGLKCQIRFFNPVEGWLYLMIVYLRVVLSHS
ncbi:MAG: hypothetical protein DCO99_03465 [Synechococcus sp. XM-24]|nr:MAG: hypothetical protein DCO99_03465 [Synechococcus sp. XM-24]